MFPLSKITAKSAGFLLRAENTVFNSHATACFRFMSGNKIDRLKLFRFDDRESGRHEDLLLQYPRVVDILLFVVERFRLAKYLYLSICVVYLIPYMDACTPPSYS